MSGECIESGQSRVANVGECIESDQFSKMTILASTRICQNWQIFGEYSNSTNSPASGHCLDKTHFLFIFQVVRLEDKEGEMKKEYSKLHERYTELFKTHIDYMERTKSILGTERLDQIGPGAARPRIAGMALNQLNR